MFRKWHLFSVALFATGTLVLGQERRTRRTLPPPDGDLVMAPPDVLVMAPPEPFENSIPLPGEPELVEPPPPELPELSIGGLQPLPPGEEFPLMSSNGEELTIESGEAHPNSSEIVNPMTMPPLPGEVGGPSTTEEVTEIPTSEPISFTVGGWPTYNCESAGARTALKIDENLTENVSSDDECRNECDESPRGCDFFSWNRRSKDCNLAKVNYKKRPGQESGSCQRAYRECEFEVKDKSGDNKRRKGKKKKVIKLKVIMTKKAESADVCQAKCLALLESGRLCSNWTWITRRKVCKLYGPKFSPLGKIASGYCL